MIKNLFSKFSFLFKLPWSRRILNTASAGGFAGTYSLEGDRSDHGKRSKFSLSRNLIIVLLLVVIIVSLLVIYSGFYLFNNTVNTKSLSLTSDQRYQLQLPRATKHLNKNFSFSLKDDKGKEVGKINYTIQTVDLQDEILIKGQKATAIKGRTFLILNLKINNNNDQKISINSKDFVRLSLPQNDKEWLAPDIHNDPVEVQAISTKYTRLAFPIDDNINSFKLRVGEISGEKQTIDLKFD